MKELNEYRQTTPTQLSHLCQMGVVSQYSFACFIYYLGQRDTKILIQHRRLIVHVTRFGET